MTTASPFQGRPLTNEELIYEEERGNLCPARTKRLLK